MKNKVEVGVYYWSNWHPTLENDRKRGKGWTEWEYTKRAIPRFIGHQQPRIPVWGYLDDSKVEVVSHQISQAKAHGIDGFIFDYSYHPDRTHEELDAFLAAPNSTDLKFCLMECGRAPSDFEAFFDDVITKYFSRPNYWRVDGGLYFSIYELNKYITAAGGVEQLAEEFRKFRQKTRDAGLGEINIVGVEWGLQPDKLQDTPDVTAKKLGLNSVTSYIWAHNCLPAWPKGSYHEWAGMGLLTMKEIDNRFEIPYYYHVSAGWDNSPRCPADMMFEEGGPLMYHTLSGEFEILYQPYFGTIITDDTPKEFEAVLKKVKKISEKQGRSFISINAWNEWTEGSYLEPDSRYGAGKLEAIRKVFGK